MALGGHLVSNAPLISVIVPVHNGERYLAEAVDSVLAQTYQPLDLIVVDDGSTDGTPDVLSARASEVRAVRQPQAGSAAAVNRGVEIARGSLLAFLDADDLWTPDKLERQIEVMATEGPALVFGYVRQFHSPELSERERATIVCPVKPGPGISRGTMLVPREVFDLVGPFDCTWRVGEFLDWYARAVELGVHTAMLEHVVMRRRLHAACSSARAAGERRDYALILAAALRRRRAATPRART